MQRKGKQLCERLFFKNSIGLILLQLMTFLTLIAVKKVRIKREEIKFSYKISLLCMYIHAYI